MTGQVFQRTRPQSTVGGWRKRNSILRELLWFFFLIYYDCVVSSWRHTVNVSSGQPQERTDCGVVSRERWQVSAGWKRQNKKKIITQVTSDNVDSTHTQIELNRQQQHQCTIMSTREESSDAYLIEFKVTLRSILVNPPNNDRLLFLKCKIDTRC